MHSFIHSLKVVWMLLVRSKRWWGALRWSIQQENGWRVSVSHWIWHIRCSFFTSTTFALRFKFSLWLLGDQITFKLIYSSHLREKRAKVAILVTCQPLCSASSGLSTFSLYAFQGTIEALKMLRHSYSSEARLGSDYAKNREATI
jgi:hypothetical protein